MNADVKRDIIIFIGLSMLGIGLFFCYGIGYSLIAVGGILTALGVFGNTK